MNQSPKVVLTGGGSGGHITPLLSLAQELKNQDPEVQITYIGHKGDNFDNLNVTKQHFDFMAFINGGKFRRYNGESFWAHLFDIKTLALNTRDFFRVIGAIFASLKILRKVRPNLVFSKGGFVAVPVGIAARLLRIPIVTHDSDSVPGLANRIIGRWAVINATGSRSKNYPYPKEKLRFVGIPTDLSLKPLNVAERGSAKRQLKIPPSSIVILVSGGGHGSASLNKLILAVAPHLTRAYPALYLVHLSGEKHVNETKEAYRLQMDQGGLKRVKVIGFSNDFPKLVSVADLVVSRAGASSLAEFALAAKACVIMPSPFLAAGHQLKNAEDLAKHDAAAIVDEQITSDELLGVISELLNNPKRREELGANLHKLANPNAAHDLAALILRTARGGHA